MISYVHFNANQGHQELGTIFLPRISKVCVQKNWLCPFHCKPRPSGITLESLGLEYIPEVSANLAEVGQNHDARKTVSATLSVLSEVGLYFGSEARRGAFKKFCSLHFNANQGNQELL